MTNEKEHPLRQIRKSFKGWTIPGPLPDLDAMHSEELGEGETLDALSGHFRIFQLKKGHRFSTDDVLTAWYGSTWCPSAGRVLDLGSGIGSVAMTAAWRLPGATFVTIEAQEESVELARKSARYNGLTHRFDIRLGDIRDAALLEEEEPFDLVMGSPPYWPLEEGTQSEHPQRIACRFEVRGDIADYVAAARRNLAPGGVFACVFPVDVESQHERVRQAASEAEMTIIRWRPVYFREEKGAYLGLFLMMKNEDLPDAMRHQTWTEPPLIIRDRDGQIHAEYKAVKMSFGFPP